jgi:hypothetical protein
MLRAAQTPASFHDVQFCTSWNDGRISIRDTSENRQRGQADNKTGSSDLPVGRFVERGVQPSLQKYFASMVGRNISMSLAIPYHTEGRFAIVTDVGTGCGGRGSVLRAMGLQGGSRDL